MIRIDDKQKQFASSIQSIVVAIAKGLSDLEKDLITHISSLLNAQQVDGKAFSQSIDTLIAEVRSNFKTNNLSYTDPRLEQSKKQIDNLVGEITDLAKKSRLRHYSQTKTGY